MVAVNSLSGVYLHVRINLNRIIWKPLRLMWKTFIWIGKRSRGFFRLVFCVRNTIWVNTVSLIRCNKKSKLYNIKYYVPAKYYEYVSYCSWWTKRLQTLTSVWTLLIRWIETQHDNAAMWSTPSEWVIKTFAAFIVFRSPYLNINNGFMFCVEWEHMFLFVYNLLIEVFEQLSFLTKRKTNVLQSLY